MLVRLRCLFPSEQPKWPFKRGFNIMVVLELNTYEIENGHTVIFKEL